MIRRKRRMKPMIPLASMGDIAFLLIIFFMLTSTFMKNNVPVDPAASADIEEQRPLQVNVTVDEEGVIWYEGAEITVSGLEPLLADAVNQAPDRRVGLSIDKKLQKPQYFDVIKAFYKAGATPVLTGELD